MKGFNKSVKLHAQVLGFDQNNRKDGTKENVDEINPIAKVIKATKQNKEKSLQRTINKLQNQINKLINLVTELTNSAMSDETKKLEIIELMKSVKGVEKSNESLEIQDFQIINNEEIENLNA